MPRNTGTSTALQHSARSSELRSIDWCAARSKGRVSHRSLLSASAPAQPPASHLGAQDAPRCAFQAGRGRTWSRTLCGRVIRGLSTTSASSSRWLIASQPACLHATSRLDCVGRWRRC